MGIRLYPSTRDRVCVFLTCDEAVAEANAEEVLRAYAASGDPGGLVIPDGATRVTLAPLAPDDGLFIVQRAGDMSAKAREMARVAAGGTLAEDAIGVDVGAEMTAWRVRQQLWTCALSVRECSALPGVRPSQVDGRLLFPIDELQRLPIEARAEIADHADRISRLSPEGKAFSGSPSGAATSG